MQQPHDHWQRVTWISALSTFLILLTISAAGLTYYTAVARPAALSAHATAVAQTFLAAQAQSTSPQYIYQQATRGKPAINDPLSDSSTSAWNKASQYQANCSYQDGAYHVLVGAQPTVGTCTSELNLANFAWQIRMTIISGVGGGVAFRTIIPNQKLYTFWVYSWGYYAFTRFSDTIHASKEFAYHTNTAINRGQKQSNLLTVIARGTQLYLYINKQFVAHYTDNAYNSGNLELLATSYTTPGADVAFSDLQIWKL